MKRKRSPSEASIARATDAQPKAKIQPLSGNLNAAQRRICELAKVAADSLPTESLNALSITIATYLDPTFYLKIEAELRSEQESI